MWKSNSITINNELKFDEHLSNICLKASRKLSALTRIRKYLHFKEIKILFKGFLKRNSNTAPLRGCFVAVLQIEQ